MKLNRKSPKHWLILIKATSWLVVALLLRGITGAKKKPIVVLYGHKLNGNLLPLYNHWIKDSRIECYFITLDKDYARQEHDKGTRVLLATKFLDVMKIAKADVFVSDHGLHHFSILRRQTSIKFVHVLHGIPYKGYDKDDFEHLHDHDEIWVSSKEMAKMHIKRFGFKKNQVKVTGFARTEDIKKYGKNKKDIIKKYGLSIKKKIILVAPTWKQDDKGRSIVPFGLTLKEFIELLLDASNRDDIQVIFRAHLNAEVEKSIGSLENVHILPYAEHPVAEEFLAISDVLITDWSSIGFDFLVTNRPIIYLDVRPPFKKGFSVDKRYRPGEIVSSGAQLRKATSLAINHPDKHTDRHRQTIKDTIDVVFGDTLDGKILERSDALLFGLIKEGSNK